MDDGVSRIGRLDASHVRSALPVFHLFSTFQFHVNLLGRTHITCVL